MCGRLYRYALVIPPDILTVFRAFRGNLKCFFIILRAKGRGFLRAFSEKWKQSPWLLKGTGSAWAIGRCALIQLAAPLCFAFL